MKLGDLILESDVEKNFRMSQYEIELEFIEKRF